MSRDRIFVVGDSHSTFWNGQDSFRSPAMAFAGVDLFYMGPLLAQNLHKPGDDFANQRTIDAIAQRAGSPGAVVSCFGEIDCRVHVVQSAVQSGRSIEETAGDVAASYFAFMSDLAARCECPIVAWAPPPTQRPDAGINVKFPKTGSMAERNFATFQFISQLERLTAARPNMAVCSLFENLIDPAGNTRAGIFYDGWHLSGAHLRAAVKLVIAALGKLGAPHLSRCFERKWPIGSELRTQNVAAGLLPSASSNRAKPAKIPASLTSDSREVVVTDLETDPWITVVLDSAYLVEAIEYTFGESTPAVADLSVTGNLRTDVAIHPAQVEELPNSTIRFRFDPPQLVTTLKLQARGTQSLRLKSARVLAGSYAT